MATNPNFAATPNRGSGIISTANTGLDGTGTLGTIFTAGANGSRIDAIRIQARTTTVAGMVRLYLSDGTNHNLCFEQPILGATPSGTNPAEAYDVLANFPLILKAGETLRASTNAANTFVVNAYGADY